MPEPAGSTAEQYHCLTKYDEENVAGPGLNWANQPDQFKDIVSSHRVSLRAYMQQDSQSRADDEDLSLARLGRMLFYTNGVTGVVRYQNGGSQLLRASPSAGALYPTEIYVAMRDIDGVEAGIYNYQVRSHELVRLWEGDHLGDIASACGGGEVFADAKACLILSGIFWRSAWRYQERGYRRVLLDTGHVLANLMAYAPHEACTPHPMLGFCDGALNGLLFFDDGSEGVLAAVPLLDGQQEPAETPLWTSAAVTTEQSLVTTTISEEEDLKRSAQVMLHRASCCGDALPVRSDPEAQAVSARSIPLEPGESLDSRIPNAIVQRRSARGYTGETVSMEDLGKVLGFAFGRDGAVRYQTRNAGPLDAHLVVHDVRGLEPGVYRVEGQGEALRRLYAGDFRDRLFEASLGQEIARGCAAVLVLTAPARTSIDLWGDRGYRHLHLEAGLLGGRLQLGACAVGLGACGIGGFFDDQTAGLMGKNSDEFVLYMVTMGHV